MVGGPQAAYHNGKTYFTYVRGDNGDACIRAYEHATGLVSRETVMHAQLSVDVHAGPALLVRAEDRRIIAVYCASGSRRLYRWLSTDPEDVSSGTEIDVAPQIGAMEYTYPVLAQYGTGPIMVAFRSRGAVVPYHTGAHWGYALTNDGGETWSPATEFWSVPERGAYAYIQQTSADRVDFLLLDGNPRRNTGVAVHHLYADEHGFYRTDGRRVTNPEPWGPESATLVHRPANRDNAGGGGVALNRDGHPCVAYSVSGSDRIHWARWTGSAWVDHDVAGWVGGGPVIDPLDASTIFAVQRSGSAAQLTRFTTSDDGATWDAQGLVWSSPGQIHRPVVPCNRGGDLRLLWLQGTFDNDMRFSLGIRGFPPRSRRSAHPSPGVRWSG